MKETKLLLTPDGFKHWKLVKPFIQHFQDFTLEVPKGFRTDLASTPRLLWILLPPFGRYSCASVCHDYLYHNHIFTKKESDQIFLELMLRYGTYKYKAYTMYLAVRLFGYFAWKN